MASTFQSTGVGGSGLPYSNVSRIQLEQIRKADFYSGSKALTVGDSGNNADTSPFNALGPGDINAEQFFTEQSTLLDDVYTLTPNPTPGPGLLTQSQVGADAIVSETTQWYGPTRIANGNGSGFSASQFLGSASAFASVQVGDVLLIKATSASGTIDMNANVTGIVTVIGNHAPFTHNLLTLSPIVNPNYGTPSSPGTTLDYTHSTSYEYLVIRPKAVLLFAYPGSGPTTGEEQTYFTVKPTSTLHSQSAPSTGQINADRITGVVPPNYNLVNPIPTNPSVDAADAVFGLSGPLRPLNLLGYRWIVYPDNGSGAPNLANPITPASVIDPSSSLTGDQRSTYDYKAGIFRLSCAPKIGGAFKVAGGTDPTSGRNNLWAVFWAVDQTDTRGAARSLYGLRSTNLSAYTPGTIVFDTTNSLWRVGSSNGPNQFVVQALDPNAPDNSTNLTTRWGAFDTTNSAYSNFRGFTYRQGTATEGYGPNVIKFVRNSPAFSTDDPKTQEMVVADKVAATVPDMSNPPLSPADYVATSTSGSLYGARSPQGPILAALNDLSQKGGYGTLHLRRGYYNFTGQALASPITVPPGIEIEGEGDATVLKGYGQSIFKFGANTPWGVWDTNWSDVTDSYNPPPATSSFNFSGRVEGFDTVWNSTRRVWAVVHADTATNSIWVNEVSPDGTSLYPGSLGVNVNDTGQSLYTYTGVNGNNHTGGHYPRIAYCATLDCYVVVWVINLASTGPQVNACIVEPSSINPAPVTSLSFTSPVTILGNGSFASFSDHPSVAVWDGYPTSGIQIVAISFAAYGSTPTPQAIGVQTLEINGTLSPISTWSAQPTTLLTTLTQPVISSTDVSFAESGDFQVVFTQRDHPLYTGTSATGAIATGNNVPVQFINTLTDSNIPDWSAIGVTVNSKVLVFGLGYPWMEGYVQDNPVGTNPSGTNYLSFVFDYFNVYNFASTPVNWAVVPASGLFGLNFQQKYPGTHTMGTVTPYLFASDQSTGNYFSQAPREVDYCRISRGGGSWFVAFQQFDTTSYLNNGFGYPNFDNGANLNFPESAIFVQTRNIPINSSAAYPSIYRHHVGVFGCLISDNGALANQQQLTSGNLSAQIDLSLETVPNTNTNNSGSAMATVSRPYISSNYSLGARGPSTPYPNGLFNTPLYDTIPDTSTDFPDITWWGYAIQISPRNHFHKWGTVQSLVSTPPLADGPPASLIPDITWTGTDWVIVSPTKNQIHSDSGNYYSNQSVNYLTDATFYFGTGGTSIDGTPLRQTLPTGAKIYFPSASVTVGAGEAVTFTVVSEHTIAFSAGVPGLVGPTVEWYLILDDQPGQMYPNSNYGGGGLKNLGYRVSADGRVIQSSSYTTFADEVPEYDSFSQLALDETIRRPNINTGDAQSAPQYSNFSYYGTSRIEYDVGFQGVAVGAPRGCNQTVLNEQPCVAIAWGENYYGFLDRNVAGDPAVGGALAGTFAVTNGSAVVHTTTSQVGTIGLGVFVTFATQTVPYTVLSVTTTAITLSSPYFGTTNAATTATWSVNSNRTVFYRQSFGPYRSGLKNLRIEMAEGNPSTFFNASSPLPNTILNMRSRVPVITRHGLPASCATGFATDGYRNIVVTPFTRAIGQANFQYRSQNIDTFYDTNIAGYYTDSIGRYALRTSGPEIPNVDDGVWMPADLVTFNNVAPGFMSPLNPSVPKVLWTGVKYVAFYTYFEKFDGTTRKIFIGMASFTGGDDTNIPQGQELVEATDTTVDISPSETATISSGAGHINPPGTNNGQYTGNSIPGPTTVFDVAYSGKVFACIWATGQNPGAYSSTDYMGGSIIGVTLFFGSGPNSTTHTYTIGSQFEGGTPVRNYYKSPKVLWDGSKFVMTWLTATDITSQYWTLTYLTMPENGFGGGSTQTKFASGLQTLGAMIPTANSVIIGPALAGVFSVYAGANIPTSVSQVGVLSSNDQIEFSTQPGVYYTVEFVGSVNIGISPSYYGTTGSAIGYAVVEQGETTNRIYLTPNLSTNAPIPVQVGDLIVIENAVDGGGAFINDVLGSWPVVEVGYDESQPTVYNSQNANNPTGTPRGYFACISMDIAGANQASAYVGRSSTPPILVWGQIRSNSATDPTFLLGTFNSPEIPGGYNVTVGETQNALQSTGRPIQMGPWLIPAAVQINQPSNPVQQGSPNQIVGFVYNEARDEYVVCLWAEQNAPLPNMQLYLVSFKHGMLTPRQEVLVFNAATENPVASFGWNGRHYFVAVAEYTGSTLQYFLYNQNLTLEESNPIDAYYGPIGFDEGQKPGPIYGGSGVGNINDVVFLNSLTVKWNNRLNRWLVLGSYLWNTNAVEAGSTTSEILAVPQTDLAATTGNTLPYWVGNQIGLYNPSSYFAPGVRYILEYVSGFPFSNHYYISAFTVLQYSPTALTHTFNLSNASPTVTSTTSVFPTLQPNALLAFNTQPGGLLAGGFELTNGSNIVTTTSSQVGVVSNTSLVVFLPQSQTPYTVASVTSGQINLSGSYTGPSAFTTTATYYNQLSGTFHVIAGNSAVTTTVSQVGIIEPNFVLYFGSELTQPYIVQSVTSSTITLISHYVGGTNTATTGYYGARYAISSITPAGNTITLANAYTGPSNSSASAVCMSATIDIASTESAQAGGNPTNIFAWAEPREDAILWTISYNTPGIVLEDADETYFDNVSFAGGVDIEEKWFRQGRPAWQISGSPVGQVFAPNQNNFPYNGDTGTAQFTPQRGMYNHMILSPLHGKTELPRYSNVRTKAKVRFGWGVNPSDPTVDLHALFGLNRRG